MKTYRVVLVGASVKMNVFQQNMARLGVPEQTLDKYIQKIPVVLKRNLVLADARKYADVILDAGGLVNIQETKKPASIEHTSLPRNTKPPENYLLCTNCGFKQKRTEFCTRCGYDLSVSNKKTRLLTQ